MKVVKRTKVNVGDGSPGSIIHALTNSGVPEEAKIVLLDHDWEIDTFAGHTITMDTTITFEWIVDE